DEGRARWQAAQIDRAYQFHQARPDALIVLRPDQTGYQGNPSAYVNDFAPVITDIANAVQIQGKPSIYIELGNEPNLVDQGWGADPANFNGWYQAVLALMRAALVPHGLFYPGLSPGPYGGSD